MRRQLSRQIQRWPLRVPFRISRGVKTAAEVLVVQIAEGGVEGRGEAVPYARYGESAQSVVEAIDRVAEMIVAGATREDVQAFMPAGAARCAVDCALWELDSRLQGRPVSSLLGETPLPAVETALTVGLDAPEAMAEAAQALRGAGLVKVKVDASEPEAQLRAVREVLPEARMIVDPNESWTLELLRDLAPLIDALHIDLLEQPLPSGEDYELGSVRLSCAVCADESAHVSADLPRLQGRYQAINIKLEKSGGLTEGLSMLRQARAAGFRIMTGCMVSTSLDIVPALHIARHAEFVDLDGPLWLQQDRSGGVSLRDHRLAPPAEGFWGAPA